MDLVIAGAHIFGRIRERPAALDLRHPRRTDILSVKTITKFVVERRRLVRQRRQQVIEEGDSGDPAGHSEIPQREGDNGDPSKHSEVQQREGDNSDSSRHSKVAEPQLDEPAAPTIWGKLKWYNRVKRYGFVELSDGSGDAFSMLLRLPA
jgi:hypothetical protein